MEVTVITTTNRRIAVEGKYSDICEMVREMHSGYLNFSKSFNYIDVLEYPRAFMDFEDMPVRDFVLREVVSARIFTDTITDISQITI